MVMKVFRATTDYYSWVFIIAAKDHDEAYRIAARSDKGYVDYDGVHQIDSVFTDVKHPQILDEF